MSIIEARGLARTFKTRKREVHAVRGVDLRVEEGEIVGFLGPNGAGKTTTLRMLTTLPDRAAGRPLAGAAGGPRHGGRRRSAPRPGGRAAADRLRAAGDRADHGRHRPGGSGG